MTLSAGSKLGPYELIAPIGAGGMGEVYRAHDPRVGRDIAIKVSAEQFSERFEREIRAVASLNHSNICTLYDVGPDYLVMELVEGPTLAERIKQGPIPLEESLEIAHQIADALEAAHEKGIVHRDLKPANIKIKPDGTVKVLDFGLAKVGGTPVVNSDNSPTLSVAQTAAGVILGTAAYMSPEQAKGKTVDKRADIWAFGCVLYEMLTGRSAFQGEDVSEILASVIKGDVNLNLLPAEICLRVGEIIGRCLQKDLSKRIRDIADVRFELEQAGANPALARPVAEAESPSRLRLVLPWVTAAVVLTAIIAGVAGWTLKSTPAGIVARLSYTLPQGQQFKDMTRHVVAISPDGTKLVYSANERLYLKPMGELGAMSIQGTELPGGVLNPVFSPDGHSLAFYSLMDQAYKRIGVSGGAPVKICQGVPPFGMSWGADNQIVIGQGNKGILRVSANGGNPETIVSVKGTEQAHGPQILPGGDSVLFTLALGTMGGDRWDKARIVVQKIASGERKTLFVGGSDARYLPAGYIVYALSGTVLAVPFDRKRLEVIGSPVQIVESVTRAPSLSPRTGVAQFSISDTGTLIYLPGTAESTDQYTLAFIDRNGSVTAAKVPPGPFFSTPRISPNGKQLVFGTNDGKEEFVSVYELSGASSIGRLTFGGNSNYPMWSGDGKHILFQSNRDGDRGIFRQSADGRASAERVMKAEGSVRYYPGSWVPTSQRFALFAQSSDIEGTLWTYSLQDRNAALLVDEPSTSYQSGASFSPDGRWFVYQSNETGRDEIYVQPFPTTGAKFQITKGNSVESHHPIWSPVGKELFFVSGGRLLSVCIQTRPGFTFAKPLQLPIAGFVQEVSNPRNFDVTPDGKQFLVVLPPERSAAESRPAPQIQVVLNWIDELKQRVPVK